MRAGLHVRFFSSSADAPRARRPTDAILLFFTVAWIGVATVVGRRGFVDSVAGFVVQVVLVLLIWIAGLASLSISIQGVSLDIDPQVVIAIVIGVVLVVAVAVMIPRIRRAIRPRLAEAREDCRCCGHRRRSSSSSWATWRRR